MAAPYHLIESKVEDAIAAQIADQKSAGLTGVTTFKGLSGSDITVPALLVVADEAEPELIGETVTGNWRVTVRVTVLSHATDTTRAAHEGFVGQIRDLLVGEHLTFVSTLNTLAPVTDFTAVTWEPGLATRDVTDDGLYRSDQIGVMYCNAL